MEMPSQDNFKPFVVHLILNKQTEQALDLLAKEYRVAVPRLQVGLPKGHIRNAYGTYSSGDQTICVMDSDVFGNPFVILHEFYHHLRTSEDSKHRGTERYADAFAEEFIQAYSSITFQETGNH